MGAIETPQLLARLSELVSESLVIFPVRHHSPGCAWHVQKLIAERKPCAVLVEGPRSFTRWIDLLTHAEARAPIAVYTYAVLNAAKGKEKDQHEQGSEPPVDARAAAYYPFCDYSPELVALREARARGIAARFIDLEFAEQLLFERDDMDTERTSLLDERHYARSRYLHDLALRQGCRDHEELWEHLFEVAPDNVATTDFIAQIGAYCHLSRIEADAQELERDGTLAREAEMASHIREALAARQPGDGPVLAVMGGYHAVVMAELVRGNTPRPQLARAAIKDENSSLIRYSFDRLDRLNGYAAGMTAPAWHQKLWELAQQAGRAGVSNAARTRRTLALNTLMEVADVLRARGGTALPVPAMSAAYEQALRLAQMRGRAGPLREDVLDAITSCFIKGAADAEGMVVLSAAQQVFSGSLLGRVPPGAGVPPLVRDFEMRARRQRLKIDDTERRRAVLDLYRRAEHRRTSRLFNGLALLGVPFAVRTAGPDFVNGIGLDRLQEHWEYEYSPLTEGALVESSMYGVTVPEAVANRFEAQLRLFETQGESRDAGAGARCAIQACVLGLHDYLPRILNALRSVIGEDAVFASVAVACSQIGLLWQSREPLEARDVAEIPELIRAAFERATYLGSELRDVQPEQQDGVLEGLRRLRELLLGEAGAALDAELYWRMVQGLHDATTSTLLRGACSGLLYAARRIDEAALAQELQGHLNGLAQPRDAVAYLNGLLQMAREAAWQQAGLLNVLDGLMASWDETQFVANLPELRLAFARMTPNETDRIAAAVGGLHGVDNLGLLVNYEASEAQMLAWAGLSQQVREVLAGDGLTAWTGGTA